MPYQLFFYQAVKRAGQPALQQVCLTGFEGSGAYDG